MNLPMDSTLDLLQGAEALIKQAEQKLNELNALSLEKDIEEKLLPVAEKFAEVNHVLEQKKEGILAILIKLMLLTRYRIFYSNIGACFEYEIRDQNHIEVCRGDVRATTKDMRGRYSLSEFVVCKELWFYHFCDWMWIVIRDFLICSPREQAEEINRLTVWADNLKKLEKELESKET